MGLLDDLTKLKTQHGLSLVSTPTAGAAPSPSPTPELRSGGMIPMPAQDAPLTSAWKWATGGIRNSVASATANSALRLPDAPPDTPALTRPAAVAAPAQPAAPASTAQPAVTSPADMTPGQVGATYSGNYAGGPGTGVMPARQSANRTRQTKGLAGNPATQDPLKGIEIYRGAEKTDASADHPYTGGAQSLINSSTLPALPLPPQPRTAELLQTYLSTAGSHLRDLASTIMSTGMGRGGSMLPSTKHALANIASAYAGGISSILNTGVGAETAGQDAYMGLQGTRMGAAATMAGNLITQNTARMNNERELRLGLMQRDIERARLASEASIANRRLNMEKPFYDARASFYSTNRGELQKALDKLETNPAYRGATPEQQLEMKENVRMNAGHTAQYGDWMLTPQ